MLLFQLKPYMFLVLCIFAFFGVNAQAIRGFGNYSIYFNENQEKIKEIQGGLDYNDLPIAFQISFSYFNNRNRFQENYDYDNYVLEKLTTRSSAINSAIGLKFYNVFSNNEEYSSSGLEYYIMPKLNVARINATGNFSSSNYFNPSSSFTQDISITNWQVYFGIEFGYEFFLSERSYNSIAVSVNYNRLNLGKPLSKLPYNNFDYSEHDNFGLGVYFFLDLNKFNRKK
ncbi:hypothetical protein OD917_07140 [Flavobacterium sp. SH_e]|uniref:hypothetical protein n=1 Tax=Flavobacterium sp. SH_e TaxID=2983767 RepID=UPI0021E50223|nr:hypothetical protein [Flavobacterium sp. SH_e]MCV2484693.1 hypothetical protein [Flavobacterium sp. SH_e]